MSEHRDAHVPITDDLIIKCYDCYSTFWSNLRKSDMFFMMDYSIEKNRTIQKFIIDEKLLIHYCFQCLRKALFKKQYLIVSSFECLSNVTGNKLIVANDSCVADVLRGKKHINDICSGCEVFIMKRFDDSDVVINYFILSFLDEKVNSLYSFNYSNCKFCLY